MGWQAARDVPHFSNILILFTSAPNKHIISRIVKAAKSGKTQKKETSFPGSGKTSRREWAFRNDLSLLKERVNSPDADAA